jgi:thiopeptide-type bacteriocin biosynthesis protein
VGTLGARTAIATGRPEAHLAPSWATVDAAARALLDEPELRVRTALRVAPSALRGAATISWLGPGDPFAEERTADVDARLEAVLAAAARWTPWTEVRRAAGADDADATDELLLLLVDDGLLQSDLAPPLVGPPPERHLRERLAALGRPDAAGPLPGPVVATLLHRPARPPTLARAAVERAAGLVPLLVGLQEALAPPAAERLASPALADALDALTETFGAGAFELGGLAAGDYGVTLAGDGAPDEDPPVARAPDARIVAVLAAAIADAAARGEAEAALDPAALAAALEAGGAPPLPPTVELFLAPAPAPARQAARPGTGWLVGMHAPAGASLGRFAHALGAPMSDALAALAAAERRARPDEEAVDVAFTPSPALADLAAHPRTRARTLALARWSADDDLAPGDLELGADPTAPEALALRSRGGGAPIVPAPLARIRSTTAPAGVHRLLVGWSLQRQHAPWALPLGPLDALDYVPRLTLEGFVVAPASWRLPPSTTPAALARWRRARRVPRFVQVGAADELLPVDLDAKDAAADLAGSARAWELWPPLNAVVDRDGRRVEAVVMLVAEPGDAAAARARADAARAVRDAGLVPPPHRAPPARGWRTFKAYGAAARQEELLGGAIVPAIRAAQAAGEIDRWFFLRYVDGPGRRHHLRVRVHAPAAAGGARFAARLADALAPARAAGAATAVEIADYFPERGRFPAAELDAVHAIFESDSELVAELLGDASEPIALAVQAADALAGGLGLSREARQACARARRRAADASTGIDDDARRAADAAFRAAGRGLRAALAGEPAPPFAAHRARVAAAARSLPAGADDRLLPTLLHLSAVRLLGADPDGERLAYTFWERTLEGLARG